MGHDQGAWDAITRIQNSMPDKAESADVPSREEFDALVARVAELEQRLRKLKVAVWHS